MRIQTIEIVNYKAFLGTYTFNVDGKNLFIYGENGSGKSSLYYALKDFFQTSVEDIDLAGLENVFVPAGKEGKTTIQVTFRPNPDTGKGSTEERRGQVLQPNISMVNSHLWPDNYVLCRRNILVFRLYHCHGREMDKSVNEEKRRSFSHE